jgi:YD repeat-containing protein
MIVRHVYYDNSGEPVGGNALDTIELPPGRRITRSFAGDLLTSLCDENGTRADLSYGRKANLHSVFVRNRGGSNWRLEYGVDGKLRRILDPLGRATEFACDGKGQVARVTLPDKLAVAAKRDDLGRIVEITPPRGETWKARFNAHGGLTAITGPARNRIDLMYSGGTLSGLKVRGVGRNSSFPIGPGQNPVASPGSLQFFGLAEPVGRRWVGRHRIKCAVQPDGRSVTTAGPAGAVKMSAPAADSTELIVAFL